MFWTLVFLSLFHVSYFAVPGSVLSLEAVAAPLFPAHLPKADAPPPSPTLAEPESHREGHDLTGLRITSVSIENRKGRTRDAFVRRRLRLQEGDPFDPAVLEAGLEGLRKTRIFKSATAQAFARGQGVHVEVVLDEKWTTLPDVRFGGGGGTAYFRAGLFDINWFGLGGQGLVAYENRNGTHNGDAWLRYPNIFGSEHLIGGGITRKTTLLTDYGPKREILGGEAMAKTTLLFDYEYSLSNAVIVGYRMEPEWVEFNDYQTTSNVKRINDATGREVSPATRRIFHRLQLRLTNLAYQGVLAQGLDLSLQGLPAFRSFGSDDNVFLTRSDLLAFYIFPTEWNLASRFTFETSSDERPENIQRVGGLSEIRGYFDGEFAGQWALYSSIEIRKNVLTTWSFVWQPAVFYDWGLIGPNFRELWQQKLRDGIGLGLRLVPDFVHLATLRLDYAWGLSDRRNEGGLSFGVLQFF